MGRIIAVTNQKGGVGKTTTSVNLAAALRNLGRSTLLIDTDAQRNSTDTYKAKTKGVETLFDFLFTDAQEKCIQHTEAGDIIAADELLSSAELRFPADGSRSYLLKEKGAVLKDKYDYIILDTPPALGIMLTNVLTFAEEIIIPVAPDHYALQGMEDLHKTIQATRKYTNHDLKISGILVIKYRSNEILSRSLDKTLPQTAENFETNIFPVKIRESTACRKSQGKQKDIFSYEPRCTTALDYAQLADYIDRKGAWLNG